MTSSIKWHPNDQPTVSSQVELIHSSDTVRTVTGNMAKPPVRIVAQPHYSISNAPSYNRVGVPTMSVQPMTGRASIDGESKQEIMEKVRAVRRQVAEGETELRRLREIEQQTRMMSEKNAQREVELAGEYEKLNRENQELRRAALRVKQLTEQLDEMRKRRQTATAAALIESRKMQQIEMNKERPRASVEPFQVTPMEEKARSPSPPKDPHPSLDESKLRSVKTDLVSLRSDSLKATKRRSWAASEGTSMCEAEMIHRILDEQRRGKTHFVPEESPVKEEEVEEEPKVERPTELPDTTTEEESSVCSNRSEEVEIELEQEEEEQNKVKGILRQPNVKLNKGGIRFDPLALLLDAALEGDLDLVKSSAEKIGDVSQANDEGITALHNAICAGHYEVVRFLIESHADVNAQDADGWSPLHCAASCNNLPMVRQLVEGGGCVLASTLSDMETPVEKCEEEEDGYDGCLKYLLAAHSSTGTINDGKVYAAYSYEKQVDDELSFEEGEELTVVAKDDVEMHWWTCTKENGETGLAPRTYLALYPAIKYRQRLNFVMFDLPMDATSE